MPQTINSLPVFYSDSAVPAWEDIVGVRSVQINYLGKMVTYLLFDRQIRTPVAVFLCKILVVPFGNANAQSLKGRPIPFTVLFPRRVLQLSLPVAMITPIFGCFRRICRNDFFKFFCLCSRAARNAQGFFRIYNHTDLPRKMRFQTTEINKLMFEFLFFQPSLLF